MEFLIYSLASASLYLVWRKPEREKLAFGLLCAGAAVSAVVFFIAVSSSWVPGINL
ncbi:MAG: hypothetical protein ACTTH5_00360 [Wolinella sp.]